MPHHLTVSEIARRAGVTPKTVRYYEAIGLLPPARRGDNGYRYFTVDDVNRLLFIRRGKALGLSLDEIGDLVDVASNGRCAWTREELVGIIQSKIERYTDRINELEAQRRQLQRAHQIVLERLDQLDDVCCAKCASFDRNCGCIPVLSHRVP